MLGYITEDELSLYLLGQKWIDTVDLKKHKIDYGLIEKIDPKKDVDALRFCANFS